MFIKIYETEIFSHYTINSLTWEVFKAYNKIDIKLISDYCIYTTFELMKRSGLCGIGSLKCAISNSKYMDNYNEKSQSSYIMHYDINGMIL